MQNEETMNENKLVGKKRSLEETGEVIDGENEE